MLASEIAKKLIELITEHGDAQVVFGFEQYTIRRVELSHAENSVSPEKTKSVRLFKIVPD
jgi:hypothetical protein